MGIAVSLVSFLETRWAGLASLCGWFGSGCSDAADYSLLHIPLALWGGGFYLGLALLLSIRPSWVFRWGMVGVGAELVLVGLMFDRNIVCVFCLGNALIVAVLFILLLQRRKFWEGIALVLLGGIVFHHFVVLENPPPVAFRAVAGAGSVLARVNGRVITLEDLEAGIATPLYKMRTEIYRLKRDQLGRLIESALTDRQGPGEGGGSGDDASLHEVARGLLAEALGSTPGIDSYLEKPLLPHARIAAGSSPAIGPEAAPVTVVEFSDYLCPVCRWAHPVSEEIRKRYDGKVRWIFKDLPLDLHPGADRLAEAAHCAGDQGRFWEFQTLLFGAEKPPGPQELAAFARSLGMDVTRFESCLESGHHAGRVMESKADAKKAGVSSTPSLVINGRLHPGAMSLKEFEKRMDDLLGKRAEP